MNDVMSLVQTACLSLVRNDQTMEAIIFLRLPTKIYLQIMTTAINHFPRFKTSCTKVICNLISHWPMSQLTMKDIFQDARLNRDDMVSVTDSIIRGLLSLCEDSCLEIVSFVGYVSCRAFQLPVLHLPKEQILSDVIFKKVATVCDKYGIGHNDNMQEVLSWKLQQYANLDGNFELDEELNDFIPQCKKMPPNGHIVQVLVECNIDLSDWISMHEEILGLLMQNETIFRLKIWKLSLSSFKLNQMPYFNLLTDLIDLDAVSQLGIYGSRKCIRLIFWELCEKLKKFKNLTLFGLASSGGPYIAGYHSKSDPPTDMLATKAEEVFSQWRHIEKMYFNRVSLDDQLEAILSSLISPLKSLYLKDNSLTENDIYHLSKSHHLKNLTSMTLESNNLSQYQVHVISAVKKCYNLLELNIEHCKIDYEHKLLIIESLKANKRLEQLSLIDRDCDMSRLQYEQLVSAACSIKKLKNFYIHPYCCDKGDVLLRSERMINCWKILKAQRRSDMELC